MLFKKNFLLIIIFGLCSLFTINSTSISIGNKIMIHTNNGEIYVDDVNQIKDLKEFFSNRIYIKPIGIPACGFFEDKSIIFSNDNKKILFMIPPCDCGYIQVCEGSDEKYIYLLPHELDWLKDYVKNSINNGVGFYD